MTPDTRLIDQETAEAALEILSVSLVCLFEAGLEAAATQIKSPDSAMSRASFLTEIAGHTKVLAAALDTVARCSKGSDRGIETPD